MIYYKVSFGNNITKELRNATKRELLIGGELLTLKELQRIQAQNYYNYNDNDFQKIECSKQKTAFIFGKRIELK